ncbi:septum formation initiator family protein [Planctomycetota bacterium]
MAETEKLSDIRFQVATAIGVSLAVFFYVYLPASQQLSLLRRELADASAQVSATSEDVGRLRAEKEALEHDPLYLERVIREELRMVRPGEVFHGELPNSP